MKSENSSEEKPGRRPESPVAVESNFAPGMPLPAGLKSLDTTKSGGDESTAESIAMDDGPVKLPEIEGYESIRELGRGGMGQVILAKEISLERNVAIKVVSQNVSGSTALRDRFHAEVKVLASLRHPNISQLLTAGTSNGYPFFVMEYIDGTTLENHAKKPMDSRSSAEMMLKVCDAVQYCHDEKVLHRDLKLSNILLTKELEPKIADFGLAKVVGGNDSATKTGEILGTPGYMSPEQAGGVVKNMDETCDVYGLGAVLYRMLTGRPPFVSPEPFQTVMMVMIDDPIPPRKIVPSIPRDLETICLKCLSKKTTSRYQSANEMREDLDRFLSGRPIKARPTGLAVRAGKWVRRNPTVSVASAIILVATFLGVLGLASYNRALSVELDRSQRLAKSGSDFANWITGTHLSDIAEIAGTTNSRTDLVNKAKNYLEVSLKDMPADPKYIWRLGNTYQQLGENIGGIRANSVLDLPEARGAMKRAIELYDQAIQSTQKRDTPLALKIETLLGLSDIEANLGNSKECLSRLKEAETSIGELSPASEYAGYLKMLAEIRQVDFLMLANEHPKAIVKLEELNETLPNLKSFRSGDLKDKEILIEIKLGACHGATGDFKRAEACNQIACGLARERIMNEKTNVYYQISLADCLVHLADSIISQERFEEALSVYQEATGITEKLVHQNPTGVDGRIAHGEKLSRVATTLQTMGRYEEAEKVYVTAANMMRNLLEDGCEDNSINQNLLIYLQSLASASFLQGKYERSRTFFDEHEELCKAGLKDVPDSIFLINQLAENSLSRALMEFSAWAGAEANPETIEESPEIGLIRRCLSGSKAYYDQIAEHQPLNHYQQNQVEQLNQIGQLVDSTVDQMKNAESDPPTDL